MIDRQLRRWLGRWFDDDNDDHDHDDDDDDCVFAEWLIDKRC